MSLFSLYYCLVYVTYTKFWEVPWEVPPKKELTLEQKEENKLIASIRIASEHAIGGVKRFNSLVYTYRTKIVNLDDQFILLASGLWNYHLRGS